MTRVLLTGASSFTGSWLAEALAARGAHVVAPLARAESAGDERRAACVRKAAAVATLLPERPIGSDGFLATLDDYGPFDLVILHGAEVGDFRAGEFDVQGAVARTTLGIDHLFKRLRQTGCSRVVVTGSVFEADEGCGDAQLNAIGDYGLAKTLSWQVIRHAAQNAHLALGKFTIPHPFGPLERPGFISHLMRSWLAGEAPGIHHPHYERDFIHVDLLVAAYAGFALALPTQAGLFRRAPGGYRQSLQAFAERLASEMRPRLACECALDHTQPMRLGEEPIRRYNTDVTTGLEHSWNYSKSWSSLAEFYSPGAFSEFGKVSSLSINS